MQCVLDMLGIILPVLLPPPSSSASSAPHQPSPFDTAFASIHQLITLAESFLSDHSAPALADLSIPFHTDLIFMRAMQQLHAAAGSSAALNHPLPHDSDIAAVIQAIRSSDNLQPLEVLMCDIVAHCSRHTISGSDTHRTLALLMCTCAVAHLLRFLGAPAAEADECEAAAMLLMQRMGYSDAESLLQEVVASHCTM